MWIAEYKTQNVGNESYAGYAGYVRYAADTMDLPDSKDMLNMQERYSMPNVARQTGYAKETG
jgi:hypothetical protein